MRGRFLAALMIVGVLALLPLVGCKQRDAQNASSASGAAAPEASVMIPNVDGSTVSVDQYKGKVVLVNFWATWCEPCKTEIPWLIEFNHKYGPKGLVILGVAMDDDGKKVVEPWVKMQRFDVKGTAGSDGLPHSPGQRQNRR